MEQDTKKSDRGKRQIDIDTHTGYANTCLQSQHEKEQKNWGFKATLGCLRPCLKKMDGGKGIRQAEEKRKRGVEREEGTNAEREGGQEHMERRGRARRGT